MVARWLGGQAGRPGHSIHATSAAWQPRPRSSALAWTERVNFHLFREQVREQQFCGVRWLVSPPSWVSAKTA